jgi:FdhE protein
LEFLYSEDRKNERAELCIACKKYILGIDIRGLIKKPPKEIASLGMIYLDILAQDKGFVPGAVLLWNNPK